MALAETATRAVPRVPNPFRVGVDGDAALVAEKHRRLQEFLRRNPAWVSKVLRRIRQGPSARRRVKRGRYSRR